MKRIPLTKGQFTLVNDEDFEELSNHRWYASFNKTSRTYYAVRWAYPNKRNSTIRMSRQIMGVTDPKIQVDHIDHNGLNNQRNNLRICNGRQNNCNQRKQSNCSSKFKGVCWHKRLNKWTSRVINETGEKKYIHLGYFENEIDAAKAYDEAAKIHYGVFAKLNFP